MTAMEIRNPEELSALLDVLHDRFYDLGSVSYDPTTRILTLQTSVVDEEPRDGRHNVYKAFLRILECDSYRVSDSAEVGEGDFKQIAFGNGVVVISGSLPVKLSAVVAQMHLRLERTSEILNTVSTFSKSYLRS